MLEILQGSRYGRYFPQEGASIEQKTQAMELRIHEKNIRFSTCPEVVMLSYNGFYIIYHDRMQKGETETEWLLKK